MKRPVLCSLLSHPPIIDSLINLEISQITALTAGALKEERKEISSHSLDIFPAKLINETLFYKIIQELLYD